MKVIEQSAEILTEIDRDKMLQLIELAGRTCYKSEAKIEPGSAGPFVSKLANVLKHESVIEHCNITVRFVTNRGISHEIVRHRIASYSQESTRYCSYVQDRFGNEITVIRPPGFVPGTVRYEDWFNCCLECERVYFKLLRDGETPQVARDVLPTSLKTELIMTANLREWRHVFKLRTAPQAHPMIQQLMLGVQRQLETVLPEIFDQP